MNKLNLSNLRKIIRNEVMSAVDEDMLLNKPELGEPYYIRRADMDEPDYDYHDDEEDYYDDDYHDEYKPCPSDDFEMFDILSEDCGCGGGSSKNMTDYSLDSMDQLDEPLYLELGIDKKHKHKHHGAYMSKTQLYKIFKYSKKLY